MPLLSHFSFVCVNVVGRNRWYVTSTVCRELSEKMNDNISTIDSLNEMVFP